MMNKLKLVSPVLMWTLVVLGVVSAFKFISPLRLIPRNMFTPFLIFPAAFYSGFIYLKALQVHRQAPLSAAAINHLVTTGIYAKVRHPIYSAAIVFGWGCFFFLPNLRMLIGMVWLTLVLFFWMKLEEQALLVKFGEEYNLYKQTAPMFIPKFYLWKK